MEPTATAPGGAGAQFTHEHHCVVFDDADDFRVRSGRFLAAGLAAGQRVMYVGAGDMADVEGFPAAMRTGQASVAAVDAVYRLDALFDPHEQRDVFVAATRTALADGFTGLRVAADVSALAGDPGRSAAYTRYEHLVDRFMSRHPVHGMCGVRRDAVDPVVLAGVACLHPRLESVAVPFQVYSTGQPQFSLVLAGEIDVAGQPLLATALRHVDLPLIGGEVVIDARNLSYIDHRGLLELAARLRSEGATGVLFTGAPGSVLPMLIDVLNLPELRVMA